MSETISLEEHIEATYDPLRKKLLDSCMRMLHADNGTFFPVDLYALGIINRSVSLSEGFFSLLKQENLICAAPLLRLQLDCALRFSAIWLVNSPHDFARRIQNGDKVRSIKDKNGIKMTDVHLVSKLSEAFPWVSKVYEETSGFIHFTDKHIYSSFEKKINEENVSSIAITGKGNFYPHEFFEAVEAFKASTEIILYYLEGWIKTKDNPHLVRTR